MLMQLGSVVFEVAPVNIAEIDHSASASFARHAVLGEMPPLEFTGEGPEHWRLRGTIHPEFNERVVGDSGLSGIDELHAMRRSGQAQFFMRGDGVPLGWVVILQVSERSRVLNAAGVGRIIDFDVEVSAARSSGGDLSAYSGDTFVAGPDAGGGGNASNLDMMPENI